MRAIADGGPHARLKGVMQAELYLSRRRADAADLTKVAVSDSVVGIAIAGDVEDVEEVGAEAQYVLLAP
jgi:hypothetical protein